MKEESNKRNIRYRNCREILQTFYDEQIKSANEIEEITAKGLEIKIVPDFIYDNYSKKLKVEFSFVKDSEKAKLRGLSTFYQRMMNKEKFKYSTSIEFVHKPEAFEDGSRELLEFILKYAEIIKYANDSGNEYKYYGEKINENAITISNTGMDSIFEILNGQEVDIKIGNENSKIQFMDEEPDIRFELNELNNDEYSLTSNIKIHDLYSVFDGKDYTYFFWKNKIHRCSKEYKNTVLKLFDSFKKNITDEIIVSSEQLPNFFSVVVMKVEDNIDINLSDEEIDKYMPKKLRVRVYLDFDVKGHVLATIEFSYGEINFNPLDLSNKVEVPRDVIKEAEYLTMFQNTGFLFDQKNLRFVLDNDDKIFEFLKVGVNDYMQKFELLATDAFNRKQIKQPKFSNLSVKIENNLLNIDMEGFNFDKTELKDIIEKYRVKKKYYRLKNGDIISLEDNKELEFINNLLSGAEIDYKSLENGKIYMPVYRSLYLNKLLENNQEIKVEMDSKYNEIVKGIGNKNEEETSLPKEFDCILRNYQKSGYRWLKAIDDYNFGGILADDMGLGKTIQVLALISEYVKNSKTTRKTSLAIVPSSLALNWKSEANKFTGDLKILVIHGKAEEREKLINEIPNYDLIITSYDLLKRDIELYTDLDYEFKYIVVDEAQYIKNNNTKNAKAIKEIKAETRYALTGTPIENSLSELWSIFDFIMPGYLFNYKRFKTEFEVPIVKDEDLAAQKKLKMLIEPFILRRTKKEVLTELPDKTITVLNNEMVEEQAKIYMTYLAKAKQELSEEFEIKGYENSQIKILALLTRLRQICCHPSLFIDNYKSESGKLNQCIEIVKDAIHGEHKILLFSGYTTMFEIIEKELQKEKITYFKLIGKTKVEERLDLVNEFNKNPDIKVFLISLKAGGTGLNLIGADVVIHYDPWWNLSVENQATDRTHRIGQKNNVQVYKMITKNSIEEKIYELQQRKAKLIDNILDINTSFINKLSKEDIMKLFE